MVCESAGGSEAVPNPKTEIFPVPDLRVISGIVMLESIWIRSVM